MTEGLNTQRYRGFKYTQESWQIFNENFQFCIPQI